MKYTILGSLAVLATVSSAQVTNNTISSSAPASVIGVTVSSTVPTPTNTAACAVQSTFELCLNNEDNYIKTCQEQDFACLCRWHKEKLSCWNNCPNDEGFAKQQGMVSNVCSMPGANISIARWTSTVAATSTPVIPTTILHTSISAVPTTVANKPSGASIITTSSFALTLIGVVAAYVIF